MPLHGSVFFLFVSLTRACSLCPSVCFTGTIVINVADLLQRWSNDILQSTLHRVVTKSKKPEDTHYPTRHSIAFFCNPSWEASIDTIPNCFGQYAAEHFGAEFEAKKYEPVNTHKYLVSRLAATYAATK